MNIERALRTSFDSELAAAAAADRLRRRVDELGLVEVAYTTVDSPVGSLLLAASDAGLVRVGYGGVEETLHDVAAEISPRILEIPARFDEARRQLDEYFAGRRRRFDLSVDLRVVTDFRRRVLDATARIPYGSVATYREIAARAGNARAVRAAGSALGANPVPIIVPCHRVVRTGGGLGGYGGGLDRKKLLLDLEGAA